MKKMLLGLIISTYSLSTPLFAKEKPIGLYPFGFGGLEDMPVNDAVDLLMQHGYPGILPDVGSRSDNDIARVKEYFDRSEIEGASFNVMGIYTNHKIYIEDHGYDDSFQKEMIDLLEVRGGGNLWVAVRAVQRQNEIVDFEKVDQFIQGIFEYATELDDQGQDKNVTIIFYPHVNNAYESTSEAMPLVEEINDPRFKVSLNLIHEYHAGLADSSSLAQTFELAKDHLGAVLLGGIKTSGDSSILSLEESEYNLRPFMNILKEGGYDHQVGFVNFLIPQPEDSSLNHPESYLKNSIQEWNKLCLEIGMVEDQTTSMVSLLTHSIRTPHNMSREIKLNAKGQVMNTMPSSPLGILSK